jgi:hypothetical protein
MDCLVSVWSDFIESCHRGKIINFSPEDISQFSNMIKDKGYPAVHHSDLYRRTYQPAYRIIGAEFLPRAGLSDAF